MVTRVVLTRVAVIAALVATIVPACAARSPRAYVRVAEGLASAHLNQAIYMGLPRLEPDQVRRGCQGITRIARLGTPSTRMQMQVGERFALAGLSVIAVDEADIAIAGVPLAIEAEDRTPPVLDLRRDAADLGRGVLRPLNAGQFLVRIYTLCAVPGAETIIDVKVVPVPPPVAQPVFPGQVAP